MAVLLLISFLALISSVILIETKEKFYSQNYLKEQKNLFQCIGMIDGGLKKEDIICILEATNNDTDTTETYFNIFKDYLMGKVHNYLTEQNITFLDDIVEQFFSKQYTKGLFNFIRKNKSFIEYIVNILSYEKKEGGETIQDVIYRNIYNILNINDIENITYIFLAPENTLTVIKSLEYFFINNSIYKEVYYYLKDFFEKYSDILVKVLFDSFKIFYDRQQLINLTEKFFLDRCNTSFMKDLKELLLRDEVSESFVNSIKFSDDVADTLKNIILKDKNFISGFFDLLDDGRIIRIIAEIARNYKDNNFIYDELPRILSYIYYINPGFIEIIIQLSVPVLQALIKQKSVDNFINIKATKHLNDYFFKQEFEKHQISNQCKYLMYTVFFNDFSNKTKEINSTNQSENYIYNKVIQNNINSNNNNEKYIDQYDEANKYMRYFFLKKIFIDTSKQKNDFMDYENCLNKKFDNNKIKILNFNFTLQPIYVIGLLDDTVNKTNLYDNILVEKYNYLLSYCLPYGTYNDSNNTELCSQEDYGKILKVFLEIPFNMNNATFGVFSLYENKFDLKGFKEYFICIFTLFVLLIPIIIRIFLFIYEMINLKRHESKDINNKLIENDKNKEIILNKEKKELNNTKTPKWYKYLDVYFSLINNFIALFDMDTKESILYNINGLTYVKGLLGTSMILYIFGLTFLILFNLPFKDFKLAEFNSSVENPIYIIPYIGLRYSPRIIFSCSGFTLIYKFLCFIEKERNYYLPKFFLIQSYKYILLIFVVLFIRFSNYYINIIFNNAKRPMLEILKYIVEYEYDNSFAIFFSFLLGYFGNHSAEWKQNLIQYFYVPLNEVFFFIIGTILISLGYKFKLKIDIVIIVVILIFFIGKIVFFVFIFYKKQKYTTFYYHMYDYGAIMLNPIFNLPSFFIGMFFGLVNYSIQRGVNYSKADNYQRIYTLENFGQKNENNDNNLTKNPTMLSKNQISSEDIELASFCLINKKNELEQNQNDDYFRCYTDTIQKSKNDVNKNTNIYNNENNKMDSFIIPYNATIQIEEYNQNISEMPFLILPAKFLNFHSQNEGRFFFKILIFLFMLLIIFFSCVQFIFVSIYSYVGEKVHEEKNLLEKLSFQKVISNYFLNIIYVIDIDLVVFMINWGFFILYSKGYKTGEIYDFFNNSFWSIFIKCYFSFIVVSTPTILCIFYQSESAIEFTISNVMLFSFISLIFIIINTIIVYSLYEMPLKKIFKSFLIKDNILIDESDDDDDVYNEAEEKKEIKSCKE